MDQWAHSPSGRGLKQLLPPQPFLCRIIRYIIGVRERTLDRILLNNSQMRGLSESCNRMGINTTDSSILVFLVSKTLSNEKDSPLGFVHRIKRGILNVLCRWRKIKINKHLNKQTHFSTNP